MRELISYGGSIEKLFQVLNIPRDEEWESRIPWGDGRNRWNKMAYVSSKKKRKDEVIEEDSDESPSGEEESDNSESDIDPELVRNATKYGIPSVV